MFVRGGVYRVVRVAMGATAAKFSVSALLFDYVLTGPISAVSAGLYLAGLLNELRQHFHLAPQRVPASSFAAFFAILVTLYFWRSNRIGIPFSSSKALRIMQTTAVMVLILVGWCLVTIFTNGYQPVPSPTLSHLHFGEDALGWLKGAAAPGIAAIAILIGLGHSLLAMSGEESLAQVYREVEAPKHKNLIRAGLVIFVFSLLFTSVVSFFAVMIIPDGERPQYFDNLISGLSTFLIGPFAVKIAFHIFVVLVGVLILSGAVNTSIIGSNGVLNRVAEDGVLPPWFRDPHRKYGTTHRIINVIVCLQLATILISRGNVYILGEAYAFGVAWSFAMKSLGVLVLRFTKPDIPRWRVPLNFRVKSIEVPLGLLLITTLLSLLASVNVLTKQVATISGMGFTAVLFTLFSICERRYKRENDEQKAGDPFQEVGEERFRLEVRDDLSPESLSVRPANILVAVHDPDNLAHLQRVLATNDPKKTDIVVLSVNTNAAQDVVENGEAPQKVIDQCETSIFSKVVYAAEKVGKPVSLVAVPGRDPYHLMLQAAQRLRSSHVVINQSARVSPAEQKDNVIRAWNKLNRPKLDTLVEIVPDQVGREALQIQLAEHRRTKP
jgi:amino acid transporter